MGTYCSVGMMPEVWRNAVGASAASSSGSASVGTTASGRPAMVAPGRLRVAVRCDDPPLHASSSGRQDERETLAVARCGVWPLPLAAAHRAHEGGTLASLNKEGGAAVSHRVVSGATRRPAVPQRLNHISTKSIVFIGARRVHTAGGALS